jgi:ABC-type nitrate/sulfonate/bicarbonate transport system substrate-binding protein
MSAPRRWLAVVSIQRAALPAWLQIALAQACTAVQGAQLPIAVVHIAGTAPSQDLVVMRRADFVTYFGPLPGAVAAGAVLPRKG